MGFKQTFGNKKEEAYFILFLCYFILFYAIVSPKVAGHVVIKHK